MEKNILEMKDFLKALKTMFAPIWRTYLSPFCINLLPTSAFWHSRDMMLSFRVWLVVLRTELPIPTTDDWLWVVLYKLFPARNRICLLCRDSIADFMSAPQASKEQKQFPPSIIDFVCFNATKLRHQTSISKADCIIRSDNQDRQYLLLR